MGIPWKMGWTSYFLVVASACIISASSSTPVTPSEASEETTTEAGGDEAKKAADLDLETQDQVAILKQINRVNEDGSYTFGYEAADGSFKIETRDVNGNVKGMFGFVNEDGELKRVSYSASNGTGFQASGSFNVPSLPGTSLSSEEDLDSPYRNVPLDLVKQRPFPNKLDTSTRIDLLPPSTIAYGGIGTTETIPTPRLPIYIFSTATSALTNGNNIATTVRPVVIQHIPKARPTTTASSAAPTTPSGELPKKTTSPSNYVTIESSDTATESTESSEESTTKKPSVIQVIRPRSGPFKKVIVTKRPVVETEATTTTTTPLPTSTPSPRTVTTTEFYSNEYLQRLRDENDRAANGVRRQLDLDGKPYQATTSENANLVTSGTEDSPDVYGGSPTPRPYTTVAYRTLFTQVPQHQRILQNSYVQNQNRYLAQVFPQRPGLPVPIPMQSPDPARLLPAPIVPTDPGRTNDLDDRRPVDPVRPEDDPSRGYPIPSRPLERVFPNPIPVPPGYGNRPTPLRPYDAGPYNPQLVIPPGLLEHLIRMLLAVRERQLSYGHIPQEPASDGRYVPYPQGPLPVPSPYPDYSLAPLPPYLQRPTYDDPRLGAYSTNPYQRPYYPDPRFDPYTAYRPPLYGAYQGRVAFPQGQQHPLVLRGLLNTRAPIPTGYTPQVPDSTTSSTTSKPRIGSVRNVQILNQSEDSEETDKYEMNVKPIAS